MSTGGLPLAVVGSGYWGKNLARAFHELGLLSLVCDRNEAALAAFREKYPGLETCSALNSVLSRADIRAVVIATPAETHFLLAREALLANKHVFVEKPLALCEEEGRALVRLADDKGLVLMVGHLLQYHPGFVALKQLVSSGRLGRINYIYSNRLNLGKIRQEENIFWSFAPHDISMILALANAEPESVVSVGGNYLHKKIADVTTTHLDFSSGLKAHIFVSWLHPFKEQKLVVVGDRCMAVFNDTMPRWEDKLLIYPHSIQWENNQPIPDKGAVERVELEEREPLLLECEHFVHCVRHGTRPVTDGHEALRVLRVLTRGQDSLDRAGERIFFDSGGTDPGQGSAPRPAYQAHESAVIEPGVQIGPGCRIWHFSHLLSGVRLGGGCVVGQNVMIGPDVSVGNGCKIQNNVSIYKGVTLEEDVFCGPSMVFTNVHNPRAHIRRMDELRPTLVRKGATLGANATIVCGNSVGRYAFVAAGAVVTRPVQDHALVMGNPARRTGWVCACGARLTETLSCLSCGIDYEKAESGLRKAGG